LKTSLAIGKGNLEEANKYLLELENLGEMGKFSYAFLFDNCYILGKEDKAVYWANKAVQAKDGLLTFQPVEVLPERYSSERLRKILTSPKLDELYEIRRKNIGLK
jgi:hypothetical protein